MRRGIRSGLAISAIGVLFVLLLAEAGLRVVSTPPWAGRLSLKQWTWLEYDPILGWQNRPGFENQDFRVDALGFRGGAVARHKAPGVIRIVCMGDSRTFGVLQGESRFRFDSDYPSALRAALAHTARAASVEVINAGVVGHTSAQGLRQLVTRVVALQPDIVVVAYGFNDHSLAWDTALRSHEPHAPLLRDLLYGCADSRVCELGLSVYQAIAAFHPAPLSGPWVDRDEYAYNLRRFAAVGRAQGFHVLFLGQALRPLALGESLPWASDKHPRKPAEIYAILGARDLADLHRIDDQYLATLYQVAKETGTPVADAAAAFRAHQGAPLFNRYDLVHPDVAGANLIADILAQKMKSLGWLNAGVER